MTQELIPTNQYSLMDAFPSDLRSAIADKMDSQFADTSRADTDRSSALSWMVNLKLRSTVQLASYLGITSPEQHLAIGREIQSETKDKREEVAKLLAASLKSRPQADLDLQSRILLGKLKAYSAITLVSLGKIDEALNVFDVGEDPEPLYQFLHGCKARGVTLAHLKEMFDIAKRRPASLVTNDTLYAILLAMGDYSADDFEPSAREDLIHQIGALYESHPSSGVHGACSWLLRQWEQSKLVAIVDEKELPYNANREWFIIKANSWPYNIRQIFSKSKYHTFVVFRSELGERQNFNGRDDNSIGFAIMDKELTVSEAESMKALPSSTIKVNQSSPIDAAGGFFWRQSGFAADILSHICGLDDNDCVYGIGDISSSKFDENINLSKRGFRLASESQWETACRSGSSMRYSFGNDFQLMGKYAWTFENTNGKIQAPKKLRPNRRGLFDMEGNLREWCHDEFVDSKTGRPIGMRGQYRVLKGGGIDRLGSMTDCATRYPAKPDEAGFGSGTRFVIPIPLPDELTPAVELPK